MSRGRKFRLFVEEHYPFGEFALIRVRGDNAEVGFVLADEDTSHWDALREQSMDIAQRISVLLRERGLDDVARSSVGKDQDFFTVSIIVDCDSLDDDAIGHLARRVMGVLSEVNPYRDERGKEERECRES